MPTVHAPFVPNKQVQAMLEKMQFKGRLGRHEQGRSSPLQPQRNSRPSGPLDPHRLKMPINFVAAPTALCTTTPPDCADNNTDSHTANQVRQQNAHLQAQLQQAQADLDATRAELKDARSRLGVAHRELAQLRKACPSTALPPCSTCKQPGHLPSSCPLKQQAKTGTPPQRPGEPDCAHFIKTGVCRFGAKCRFNHPPTHTPPVSETGKPAEPPQPQPSVPTAAPHARAYTALHGRTNTAPNKPGLGYKAPPLFEYANRKGACSICGDETSLVLWYTDRVRLPDHYSNDPDKYDAPLKRAHDNLQICTNCRTTHPKLLHLQLIFNRSLAYCPNAVRHYLAAYANVAATCVRLAALASDADIDTAAAAALPEIQVPQDTTDTDHTRPNAGYVIALSAAQVSTEAAQQKNMPLVKAAVALVHAARQHAFSTKLHPRLQEHLDGLQLPDVSTPPVQVNDVQVNDAASHTAIIALTKQNDEAEKMLAAQQQQLHLLDRYIVDLLNMPPSPALDQVQESVQNLHAAAQQTLVNAQQAFTQAGNVTPQHVAQLERAVHIAQQMHALTGASMTALGLT
jgi:hypothetical protein